MEQTNTQILHLGGMLSACCVRLVELILKQSNIDYVKVQQGKVELNSGSDAPKALQILQSYGFSLLKDKEHIVVEQIKIAVIELVHLANNSNSIIRNSDYLVEKLDLPYSYLSAVFSRYENQTLEKFIIRHKIEKTKELLDFGELTLSEIAYQMGYSSVQYLSTQFKKLTGVTVSEYKQTGKPIRIPFDEI